MHAKEAMIMAAAFVWIGIGPIGRAAEHPQEHPTSATKPTVTLEEVAKHIESYVKTESKAGAFNIEDKQAGKQLALKLDRVHRDRLSQVGSDLFFVCADFKSPDGKVYDLDFFVQGTSKDNLHVLPEKTSIHKENGKERYTWAQNAKTGIWEQKPVGQAGKEHPKGEHPSREHP
jgi:hypothetical protein